MKPETIVIVTAIAMILLISAVLATIAIGGQR